MSDKFAATLNRWAEISVHRNMRETGEFLRSAGISMPQISVLMRLKHHGPCRISDVSEQLNVTNAAASQMIQRLVDNGLLERSEGKPDRRVKMIKLAPLGEELLQGVMNTRRSWVTELAAAMPAAHQEIVIQALELLIEAAGNKDQITTAEVES